MVHTSMPATFSAITFHSICDKLGTEDADLGSILNRFGYPPLWSRPNTFETIVHFILEQQVSLASALAALQKLKHHLTEITPERVMGMSEEEMRACYCSRQKQSYIKNVASAILNGTLDLPAFDTLEDDEIRMQL